MTWQGKRRKQLPGNWGTIRKQVLVRDGYRCTAVVELGRTGYGPNDVVSVGVCSAPATEVHHVNGPTDHRLSSLRSICAYHHNLETQAEARQAQAKARALNPPINPRLRPKTKHPGLA